MSEKQPTAKFRVRYGTHFEPDWDDTTFQAEKRPQRERKFVAGDVFESPRDRVKQHGEKFQRESEHTPVTDRPIYTNLPENLDVVEDAPLVSTATTQPLTEDQLNKMPFADLKKRCDEVGIDLKGTTDRKKVIQLILDEQSA